MENNSFKSSLFGGFRRKDVIAYIEKSAAESGERISALEEAESRLTKENESLRSEVASASGARDRLSDALSDNYAKQEELQSALENAREELAELRDLSQSLARERDTLRGERDALRAECEALRDRVREYEDTKAGLAELELAAHHRADTYEAEAKQRGDAYEAEARERADAYESGIRTRLHGMVLNCRTQCDRVMAALDETCKGLTAQLRQSTETISGLPEAFQTLRQDLDELDQFE